MALLSGTVIGWLLTRNTDVKIDIKQGLVKLPGSIMTLMLILMIFSAKYYFGYLEATHPSNDPEVEKLSLSISLVCTGIFIGRLACYFFKKQSTIEAY